MAYIDEWRRWHAARTNALTAPYGPLSSMCGVRVRATVAAPHAIDGVHALRGRTSMTSQWSSQLMHVELNLPNESIEMEALSPQQRNLIETEGIFGLEAIEDRVSRIHFGGLEVFQPHHDWLVPAYISELDEIDSVRVIAPCTDGRDRTLVLDALISFTLEGRQFQLLATHEPQGAFHVVFSDATRIHGFGFRNLRVSAPDDDGMTTLDFNRTVLPLASLSTRFPAVSAPPGNHLDLPITAGEHRPYLLDAETQAQFA